MNGIAAIVLLAALVPLVAEGATDSASASAGTNGWAAARTAATECAKDYAKTYSQASSGSELQDGALFACGGDIDQFSYYLETDMRAEAPLGSAKYEAVPGKVAIARAELETYIRRLVANTAITSRRKAK